MLAGCDFYSSTLKQNQNFKYKPKIRKKLKHQKLKYKPKNLEHSDREDRLISVAFTVSISHTCLMCQNISLRIVLMRDVNTAEAFVLSQKA